MSVKIHKWSPEADKPVPPVEHPKSSDSFDVLKRPFWVEKDEEWEQIKAEARSLAKEHRDTIMQYREQESNRRYVYETPYRSERNFEKQEILLDLFRLRATWIK
jgi:hypothetical protein